MRPYPNLEAFCGRKRSGKDFCLESLIDDNRGRIVTCRLSFSDGLRDIAHMIYPWLPARIPDELKDVPFVHPKNPRGLTPREIWIHLGNENGLRFVQPDIFLDLFIRNCLREIEENPQCLYIISDVRTKPEYDWIKANQIKLTRISKANREGIVEDDVEAYVDQMEVDHEFINPFNGKNAFIEFYRSTL